ncbi:MAG: DNA-3-methyladenine glycosylase [Ilumatobacteraceae bacterium]
MAGRRLPASFFSRDATVVAPDLLHRVLVAGGQRARITEVEAYTRDDEASHSFRGPTRRNAPMFGPPGMLYVYFVYGVHHCINIVTGADGDGQAVLVRSAVIDGIELRRSAGPGRLAKVLGADLTWNGRDAEVIDDGAPSPPHRVTPRIGISRAVDLPRRWLVE